MKWRWNAEAVATLGVAALVLVPAISLAALLRRDGEKLPPATSEPRASLHAQRVTGRSAGARPARVLDTPAGSTGTSGAQASPFSPEPAWGKPRSLADKRVLLALQQENSAPKRSRDLLRDALRLDPHHERALRMLATKLLIDEKYEEAQSLAERCTAVNAGNQACKRVSELLPKLGSELKRVIDVARKCSELDPKNLSCARMAFNAQLAGGKIREAAQLAERIAQLSPNSPGAQLAQGRIAAAEGAYGEARVLFEWACHGGESAACFRAELLRAEGF